MIVGRSMVVGRPLSMLMLKENVTVTICHTKTEKLLNRQGTGLCPFEQAVLELQKPEDCLPVIRQTLARLMAGKK